MLFEEFDVVLLDYFLGKDCGYDILKQANEAGVTKPIVLPILPRSLSAVA